MDFVNVDLLTVGAAVAALTVIGVVALLTNTDRRLGRYFALFCFVNAIWGTVNYVSYQIHDPELALISLRLILFTAIFQTLSFALFIEAFGSEVLPRWFAYVAIPIGFAAAIPALTPLYFVGIQAGGLNVAPQPVVSPAIGVFAVVAIAFVLIGLWSLFKQLRAASGERKEQLIQILIGTALMFGLIIFLNFLAPVLFNTTYFVPLGAVFVLPFAIMTAYAILNQHLFNFKVAATAVLVFLLSIVSFADIIFSNTLPEVLLRVGVFTLVLVFGINLIRGVLREVEQRERIEKLAAELQETNARQEGLIHFIGHEVKGFLTKAQNTFSLMEEGDLGAMPETMKPFVVRALQDTKDGVESVSDILKASNLKKGTVNYDKKPFDLAALVKETVEKEKPTAEGKKLALLLDIEGEGYQMTGDGPQIADHVLRNLIENSINYTPTGSIHVSLKKAGGKYVFAVSDTGIGISPEDKARLFTEGGHGKDSQKVNVHSTGYGLFIAKQIVEAHGGTIRAESEGPGQGSTFTAEFPIA
jgi:signal transduction histidine kinase